MHKDDGRSQELRILVTGSSGFIGTHLTHELTQRKHRIYGLDLQPSRSSAPMLQADLSETDRIRDYLKRESIDAVIHLAGSWSRTSELEMYRANVLGTSSLLSAISASKQEIRTMVVGSSAQYGNPANPDDATRPVVETDPFLPITSYGVAKAATDHMAYQFQIATGLPVYRVRLFNVIGPGQNPSFFCPRIATQIAAAERGEQPPTLKLTHLKTSRDFVDVHDVARGLALILEKAPAGEAYQLCSGSATSLQKAVDILLRHSKVKLNVQSADEPLSPLDLPFQVGSFEKVKKATGWQPEIDLEASLLSILKSVRQTGDLKS